MGAITPPARGPAHRAGDGAAPLRVKPAAEAAAFRGPPRKGAGWPRASCAQGFS